MSQTLKNMPTIAHFDIAALEIDRAKDFYEKLFDWKIKPYMGSTEYYAIETKDLKGDIGLGGGMALRGDVHYNITNFIQVDSVDDYVAQVKALGGTIIEPKMAIPTVGFIATCKDTEGNDFGLLEVTEESNQ